MASLDALVDHLRGIERLREDVASLVGDNQRLRADNVRLPEEALKNPALDRATIESLTYQLTGHRSPRTAGSLRYQASPR